MFTRLAAHAKEGKGMGALAVLAVLALEGGAEHEGARFGGFPVFQVSKLEIKAVIVNSLPSNGAKVFIRPNAGGVLGVGEVASAVLHLRAVVEALYDVSRGTVVLQTA